MDNEIIKKWEVMLAALTVAQKSSLICSEAEIEQVEKELGFKFPAADGSRKFFAILKIEICSWNVHRNRCSPRAS